MREGNCRFQFCIERFQCVRRLFLQLSSCGSQPGSRTVGGGRVYQTLWVRRLRDSTISGLGFNLFKPLRRYFRAIPFCCQPSRAAIAATETARFKRSTIGSAVSSGTTVRRNKYRTTMQLWQGTCRAGPGVALPPRFPPAAFARHGAIAARRGSARPLGRRMREAVASGALRVHSISCIHIVFPQRQIDDLVKALGPRYPAWRVAFARTTMANNRSGGHVMRSNCGLFVAAAAAGVLSIASPAARADGWIGSWGRATSFPSVRTSTTRRCVSSFG